MFAIKANRQYKILPEDKQKYIGLGYRIAELEKGKLVFEEVETPESKEIVKLKAEVKRLEAELQKDKLKSEKPKGEGK